MDKAEGVAYAKALGHVSGAWGLSSEAVQLGQREKERGKRLELENTVRMRPKYSDFEPC